MTDEIVTQAPDKPPADEEGARFRTTLITIAALIGDGLPAPRSVATYLPRWLYLAFNSHADLDEWARLLDMPEPKNEASSGGQIKRSTRRYVHTGWWLGWSDVQLMAFEDAPEPKPVVLIEQRIPAAEVVLGDLVLDDDVVWRCVDEVREADGQVLFGLADTAETLRFSPGFVVRVRRADTAGVTR